MPSYEAMDCLDEDAREELRVLTARWDRAHAAALAAAVRARVEAGQPFAAALMLALGELLP
jgi:hypothetical protein